jgi:drug/metabolite transporter (DMT)-like permease
VKLPAAYTALPPANRAVILMVMSAISYALTYATIRELTESFSVYQLVLFRTGIGTAVMLPWVFRSGIRVLRTSRWKLYGVRALAVYTGNLCWFYALAEMALADATALSFLMPVFAALILAFWMREQLNGARLVALFLGLAGAFVVIRPGFTEVGLATLSMLYATIVYGGAMAVTRVLAKTEDSNAVVFYMFALNLPLAFGPGVYHWTTPSPSLWLLIVVFAILSLYSQIFMTRSLALAEAAVVMPSFYLQLPIAALFGFFLFGQVPDIWLIPGAILIIGGSYYSVWSESRRRRLAAEAAVAQEGGA